MNTSSNNLISKPANISVNKEIFEKNRWDIPDINTSLIKFREDVKQDFRLYHLTELGTDKAHVYRAAMANVVSALNNMNCSVVYLLNGRPDGVELYLGVTTEESDFDIAEAGETLKGAFEGNFLGAKLNLVQQDSEQLTGVLKHNKHLGLITGVPSFNEFIQPTEEDFQSIDILANSLHGETWQLIIIAKPGDKKTITDITHQLYDLSTGISEHIHHSVQKSENEGTNISSASAISISQTKGVSVSTTDAKSTGTNEGVTEGSSSSQSSNGTNNSTSKSTNYGKSGGTSSTRSYSESTGSNTSDGSTESKTKTEGTSSGISISLTSERTNKKAEEIQKHISTTMLDRFKKGSSKGMFQTAIYVAANSKGVYERLSRGVLSIFQGNKAGMSPLQVNYISTINAVSLPQLLPLSFQRVTNEFQLGMLTHSIVIDPNLNQYIPATWLNSEELALIAGLPSKELPGLKLRKTTQFALNGGMVSSSKAILNLGKIIQNGRILKAKDIKIAVTDLSKHIFVTGVTGAGKTTTCMKILIESKLPFMVIEPAKTEYRALHERNLGVEYYTLGKEELTQFRLNPFELVSKQQNLLSQISTLNATLAAVFPMEASMPFIVEEAIINAYKSKGWDINSTTNYFYDDPWSSKDNVWPTFSDMIGELDSVIKSKGMGKEFEEKYKGSLVSRLTTLTKGVKGRMLNTKQSLNFDSLLDKKVVFELEELKDEQDKALFMALILSRLAECVKHRHRRDPNFKHLTLLEEAHRLLSKPDIGDGGSKKMGVEMFANMLAEVRKYGEGLIIADQIPSKLIGDVIKNTNIKIVHRLFAADDRDIIGDSMGLNNDQKAYLPLLLPGETVMYCGGWHDAVWVKITEEVATNAQELSEATIRKMGERLLWEQREYIYPLTSKWKVLSEEQVFKDSVLTGVNIFNMFLFLNKCQLDKKQTNKLVSVQKRYSSAFNILQGKLDITSDEVGRLITDLSLDAGTQIDIQEEWKESYLTNLPKILVALSSSYEDFTGLYGSIQDRQLKHFLDYVNSNIFCFIDAI